MASFLDICDTFRMNGVSADAIRLRLFPFSLRDKTKLWLNSLESKSHEVIELGAKELSHTFTLSLREKENNLNLIASVETPFILKVSQISRNDAK